MLNIKTEKPSCVLLKELGTHLNTNLLHSCTMYNSNLPKYFNVRWHHLINYNIKRIMLKLNCDKRSQTLNPLERLNILARLHFFVHSLR